MQITIASIQTKPKRSIVQTTDGRKLGVWTDKLGQMGLVGGGAVFDVETQDSEWQGKTLTNIVKATLVTAAPPAAISTNGHTCRTTEQLFVQGLLEAYIGAGKCANPAELKDVIAKLREVWRQTFGFDDRVFTPNEAGRKVA